MTYIRLKNLTKALLIGDNVLTKDADEMLGLVDYAFDKIANDADALLLFTDSISDRIVRQGPGKLFIRRPELPVYDADELDIDHELGFAVARFIASFVSREKMQFHESEAQKIIRAYNQKVQVFTENLEQDGDLDEYSETDMFGKRKYP